MTNSDEIIPLSEKERFFCELEFIQSLANPTYLSCMAKIIKNSNDKFCSPFSLGTEELF